jgi:hypothetical protein
MKRITVRPGKSVVVSDEALARARSALAAFGVRGEQLAQLAEFKGDVTIGQDSRGSTTQWVRERVARALDNATAAGRDATPFSSK